MSTARYTHWRSADGTKEFYKVLAWVNFRGSGTIVIREAGNVSSITDHGTGDYTINFSTALATNTYGTLFSGDNGGSSAPFGFVRTLSAAPSTTGIRVGFIGTSFSSTDVEWGTISIVGNG